MSLKRKEISIEDFLRSLTRPLSIYNGKSCLDIIQEDKKHIETVACSLMKIYDTDIKVIYEEYDDGK